MITGNVILKQAGSVPGFRKVTVRACYHCEWSTYVVGGSWRCGKHDIEFGTDDYATSWMAEFVCDDWEPCDGTEES